MSILLAFIKKIWHKYITYAHSTQPLNCFIINKLNTAVAILGEQLNFRDFHDSKPDVLWRKYFDLFVPDGEEKYRIWDGRLSN